MPQSRVGPTARVTGMPDTAVARVNSTSLTPALTRANAMPASEPKVKEAEEVIPKAPKAKKRK